MTRSETFRFRDEVTLYLHRHGLFGAGSLTREEQLEVPFLGKGATITGAPWTLMARYASGNMSLSTSVKQASDLADHFGQRSYAAVLSRRGYSLKESYCVTTLDVLTDALVAAETLANLNATGRSS